MDPRTSRRAFRPSEDRRQAFRETERPSPWARGFTITEDDLTLFSEAARICDVPLERFIRTAAREKAEKLVPPSGH